MNDEFALVWKNFQELVDTFLALLPNLGLALIVFLIFFYAARAIKQVVKRITRNRRHARNLGLVLGKSAQRAIILNGIDLHEFSRSRR
jgi:small conductance mechanosensitive channel